MGTKSRLKRERAYRDMIKSVWCDNVTGSTIGLHVPRIFRSELPASLRNETDRCQIALELLARGPKNAGQFISMLRTEGRRREVEKLIEEGM